MTIHVNGKPRELPASATVATVVERLGAELPPRGVAVAVDGEVVPRGAWGRHGLHDGARVEVLTAVQGG